MNVSDYKHKITEVVRFHEVDLLGICNNAVYFNYFEDARLSYVNYLKKKYKLQEFMEGYSFFIMAHNDCDYLESAHLDDELTVYTRINFMKNSSFGFKHIIEKNSTNKIIARGGGVMVHIDKESRIPSPIPMEFYEAVRDYEKQVQILKST